MQRIKEYTKRGVLYIGYNCNARCIHCYFRHKKWDWRQVEDVKGEALGLREIYGLEYVDITGGEPTVYPDIEELIEYCASIGLMPSIITNGFELAGKIKTLKSAGLRDCLISVHAVKESAKEIYGVDNVWPRLIDGITAAREYFGFWRSNTCVLTQNYKHLKNIACFLAENDVRIANFIAFNPYHEWKEKNKINCQIPHLFSSPYLIYAINVLEKSNIEVNVRYFPFCVIEGYEKNIVNWRQLPYDRYEWDLRSWLMPWYNWPENMSIKEMAEIVSRKEGRKGEACSQCALTNRCDGFSRQYMENITDVEASPYEQDFIYRHKRNNFIVIAYYTIGTKYERWVKRLEESLNRFNIDYEIEGIDNLGSWQKNTHHKPHFIKKMLQKHAGEYSGVLYVDADAVIHRYPALLHILDCDFAVHHFTGHQLASGTMYFKNTSLVMRLIQMWIDYNAVHSDKLDQQTLQDVIREKAWDGILKIYELPASYCTIFDLTKDINRPVIEHFQGSRTARKEIALHKVEQNKYSWLWETSYKPSACAIPLIKFINTLQPQGKLLEIGCGDGSTIFGLRERNLACDGLDITLTGLKGYYGGFIEASVWSMPLEDNSYDFTFSTDTLEHIPPDCVEESIKEILRVTKRETFHCIATFSDRSSHPTGEELHLTIQPIEWWQELFNKLNHKKIVFTIVSRKEFLSKWG